MQGPVPAGRLEYTDDGRYSRSRFRYGNHYVQRKDAVPVDPKSLPLPDGKPGWIDTTEGFDLFGGIRDAAPDGWGRHLLDRAAGEMKRVLGEFDYLVAADDGRVGALAFGPDLTGPQRIAPWMDGDLDGEKLDLGEMVEAARTIDDVDGLDARMRRFIVRGSSLGGARPKADVDWKDSKWLAKFARKDDRFNIVRAEYANMVLAKECGIDVPDIDLVRVFDHDVYLIRRFDRVNNGDGGFRQLPFVSGLSILGAHESEARLTSYGDLAEALRLFGLGKSVTDRRELFRRMVFNILTGNTDDHLRNHGFLFDGKGWRLSPGYDIVPHPQTGTDRYLAIGVGERGRVATLCNALSGCARFGIHPDEARAHVIELRDNVAATWEATFRACGVSDRDIARLATCFAACGEELPA
jgi:serine/threonine-protein kinase HipA